MMDSSTSMVKTPSMTVTGTPYFNGTRKIILQPYDGFLLPKFGTMDSSKHEKKTYQHEKLLSMTRYVILTKERYTNTSTNVQFG